MLKLVVSMIIGSICMLNSCTSRIGSPAYDLMLKALLSHTVPEVSVEKAFRSQNTLFIDARSAVEYNVSHLKNALWVGYEDFKMDRLSHVPKNQPLIVYCSIGYRSEKISERLLNAGYKNVSNMYGGIFEWVNQGKPVYKSGNKLTTDIHPYSAIWSLWVNKGTESYN